MADGDFLDEELAGSGSDTTRLVAIADRFLGGGEEWQRSKEVLDGVSWRPDLQRVDKRSALHIHVVRDLRPYILRRMRLAKAAGYTVHVALELAALYDEELMKSLGELDAHVHLIEGESDVDIKGSHVLGVLADNNVLLSSELRTELGKGAWERRREGTAWIRGRRFEALVSFLLSQIDDFFVKDRNYRTETEELDVVVQARSTNTDRCWAIPGAPFVLVEAKNWEDPVDQREVSTLLTKMKGKRGFVRIGIIVGGAGFTSDAEKQELRFSGEEGVVCLLGPEEIDQWIVAPDGDEYLEQVVRHAIMR